MSCLSTMTVMLVGMPLFGLASSDSGDGGVVQVVLVGIVAPFVLWALRRQDKKDDRHQRWHVDQAIRRDRLLRVQIATQQQTLKTLQALHAAMDGTKEQLDDLPARVARSCPAQPAKP